ncbi:kinase-like protein [Xylaria venustula]|nr:kinase-like protein [Xylaria venustula]
MSASIEPDRGYFVDESDEDEVEDEAEPKVRYLEGLYCPLRIGQVLGNAPRYRIEHKLGWGGYSTVWLARNLSQDRLVALKVMSPGWRGDHESHMNSEITRRVGKGVSDYLVVSQRVFYIQGLRGQVHPVLVFPWRGPSVQHACFHLTPAFRVPAAKHLLAGLKRLHAAGIIHSDLNDGAVMWHIGSRCDRWSTSELYQHLGRPRKVLLSSVLANLPKELGSGELVHPVVFPENMLRPGLHLGDFGHSIISGTVPRNPMQLPLLFCAPERFHGCNQTFASDIWSFTCIFAQLYLGSEITYGDGLSFVSRLVGTLGPFPVHWKGRYPENCGYDWWYDQTCTMPRTGGNYITLEERIDNRRPEISPKERELALEVFRKGFQYLPENRPTAAQFLEDPSFKALMAYY